MFQVVVQPDDKLCIYSYSSNRIVLENASEEDVIEYMINNSYDKSIVKKRTQDLIIAARHSSKTKPIHKFYLTYEQIKQRINGGIKMKENMTKVNEIAVKNGYKVISDSEHAAKIAKALDDADAKYGERYCPCSVLKNQHTICPCQQFRCNPNLKECHCKLYIRE